MKILAFADMHSSFKAFENVMSLANKEKPDAICCAGDISVFEKGLYSILHEFDKLNIPFIIVHGNHETKKSMDKIEEKLKNIIFIHKKHYIVKGCCFLGFGGGGFSRSEPELDNASEMLHNIIEKNPGKKIVMVTHAPPYHTKLDRISANSFCGSKTVRRFIEHNRVDVLICGHIHENSGRKDKINNNLMLNPGPYGKIVRI